MKDVENLIAELTKRDMHLVMDLVVNHTSDQVSIRLGAERHGSHTGPRLKRPAAPVVQGVGFLQG